MPTSPHGESVHLRMLTRPEEWMSIDQLGLSQDHQRQIHELVTNPRGLVLVAGPTGAGKTTTLYATAGLEGLADLVTVSIEDPVEYDLNFVRQVQVDEHHGLTMAQGLKSLLRMDADAILIGEIRDEASAQIAAQAGLAGRLVLSTIHARDAATAIEGMHFLGVPDYVLGSSLRMVISQNLVRSLCGTCCREVPPDASARAMYEHYGLKVPPIVCHAVGCEACHERGYRLRTGVFEVVPIDDELGQWLIDGPRRHAIRQHLIEAGMEPLAVDALRKVAKGTVSMEEVQRLIGMSIAMNHNHQHDHSNKHKVVHEHHDRTFAVRKR
jgi:type II secretory ATPase GspE/PulE/Tfp pilus assembly ATPase PilB-like protein